MTVNIRCQRNQFAYCTAKFREKGQEKDSRGGISPTVKPCGAVPNDCGYLETAQQHYAADVAELLKAQAPKGKVKKSRKVAAVTATPESKTESPA